MVSKLLFCRTEIPYSQPFHIRYYTKIRITYATHKLTSTYLHNTTMQVLVLKSKRIYTWHTTNHIQINVPFQMSIGGKGGGSPCSIASFINGCLNEVNYVKIKPLCFWMQPLNLQYSLFGSCCFTFFAIFCFFAISLRSFISSCFFFVFSSLFKANS